MTILLDDRIGSAHYAPYLGECCVVTRLESGDAAFAGADGIMVGVEIKRILDAVNCMYSGRLADHQIPLMRQQYDVAYLIVEGLWQSDEQGVLQYYKGELGKWGHWRDCTSGRKRLMFTAFEKWLTTLEQLGGVHVRSTPTPTVTADLLLSLSNWWADSDHRSFRVMQEASGDSAALTRPTMLRRMLAELPNVGWERSGILAKRFSSMAMAVRAPMEAWLIERQIGPETAKKIQEALNGSQIDRPSGR